jgi:hypothetical protein
MNEQGKPEAGDSSEMDLTRFDGDFAEAPVEEKEFEPVPDGKYQVTVDKVEITTAKTSGNPMLKWTLKVLAPSHRGRLLWRHNVMASRENIRWLKNDLHVCGLDLQKLSELPAHLERLLDVKLEVTKRTKGDSENVYFNRRIVLDDATAAGGGSDAHGGSVKDDVPF